MIIVLKPKHTPKELTALLREIKRLGYKPHVMRGVARTESVRSWLGSA